MYVIPVPAFSDNYLWLLHDGAKAIVVDPGDAAPVEQVLQQHGLQLVSILVMHHHADHIGGVAALRQAYGAQVYGPATEAIPEPYTPLRGGEQVNTLGLQFDVIDVPGHTAGHIAFYCPDINGKPHVFCGDTLFSGGCGRVFEGTPAQMLASLDRLAALPGETAVCCAHEYTLSNLKFAHAVDPTNPDLIAYTAHCVQLRAQGLPTLPAQLAQELLINPFLRCRDATIMAAAQRFEPSAHDAVSVFAALRQWKNQFQ